MPRPTKPKSTERTRRRRSGAEPKRRRTSSRRSQSTRRRTSKSQIPTSTRKRRRRKPAGSRGGASRFRFVAWVVVCGVMGCLLVLGIDAFGRADFSGAGALWDKIVDRIMDNDVPKRAVRSPVKKAPPKSTAPAVKKAAPKPRPAARTTGTVRGDKPSSRADVAPLSPDAYAKGLAGHTPPAAGEPKADINALIDRATRR